MVSNVKLETFLASLSEESNLLPLNMSVKTNAIWDKENWELFSSSLIRSVVFSDGTLSAKTASHGGHYIEPQGATYVAALTIPPDGIVTSHMNIQISSPQLREQLGKQRISEYKRRKLTFGMYTEKRKR